MIRGRKVFISVLFAVVSSSDISPWIALVDNFLCKEQSISHDPLILLCTSDDWRDHGDRTCLWTSDRADYICWFQVKLPLHKESNFHFLCFLDSFIYIPYITPKFRNHWQSDQQTVWIQAGNMEHSQNALLVFWRGQLYAGFMKKTQLVTLMPKDQGSVQPATKPSAKWQTRPTAFYRQVFKAYNRCMRAGI